MSTAESAITENAWFSYRRVDTRSCAKAAMTVPLPTGHSDGYC
jgi:hypothetical protein